MHGPDADYRTSCPTLTGALQTISAWSGSNPGHVPVVIQLELKGSWPWARLTGGARVPRWTTTILDDLDGEIRAVFDDDRIITPDRVRGDTEPLEHAVLASGWPLLDDVRGHVRSFLDYCHTPSVRSDERPVGKRCGKY